MADTRSLRGRPKGSGIDDASRLREVAKLIRETPDLKPTTAIRAIGVTDPSTIRRLRDKFNEQRADLIGTPPAAILSKAPSLEAAVKSPAPRVVAASVPADDRKTSPVMAGVQDDAQGPKPAGWLTSWFGVGIALATSAAQMQLAVIDQMLRVPQFGWDAPLQSAGGPSRPTLLH